MITEIALENVRIFQGAGWSFNLPPLTVICGTNSSGKSTVLKSLLLLRQSQGLRESSEESHGRLRFFGSEVDLGSYQSFVSRNNQSLDITLSLNIKDKIDKSFLSPAAPRKRNAKRPARERQDYHLKSTFVFGMQRVAPQVSPFFVDLDDIRDNEDANSEKQLGLLKKASFEVFQENRPVLSWHVESTWNKPGGEKNVERFEALIPREIIQDWFGTIGRLGLSELGDGADKDFARFEVRLRGLLPSSLRVKIPSGKLKGLKDSISRLVDWPLPPPLSTRSEIFDGHYHVFTIWGR
jgi:energy-coupling factor transporter ATP-binding protein EcfA2